MEKADKSGEIIGFLLKNKLQTKLKYLYFSFEIQIIVLYLYSVKAIKPKH